MKRNQEQQSEDGREGGKAGPIRIAIIASSYNTWITGAMTEGARQALPRLAASFGRAGESEVFDAPGAFELPVLAAHAIHSGRFDGVVCIGCIIKGETRHDAVIGDAIADAIQSLSCESGVPIGFGVLTVDTPEQAEARAGGALGNKGAEAMEAVLATLGAIERIHQVQTQTHETPRASG